MGNYFKELDPAVFAGKIVILDLDGTLVPDGASELSVEEEVVLRAITRVAKNVVVVSNNLRGRANVLHERYGVEVAESAFKKPFAHALGNISLPEGERVVVGDKVLTDGWFAKNIGASYIRSKTLYAGKEPLWLSLSHVLDEIAWRFVMLIPFVALMRPKQWVKNLLIFAPLFFAYSLFSYPALLSVAIGFVAFCLTASAGYAFNDAADIVADALHPKKRLRPVASDRISPKAARVFASVLAMLSVLCALLVPAVIPWLITYLALSFAYSSFLKKIPFVELVTVVSFFLIRVEAGGALAGVPVSGWLVGITSCAALFVLSGKRYVESLHEKKRAVLTAYSPLFLKALPAFSASLTIGAYTLYTFFGPKVPLLPYSSFLVIVGILWYLRGIYRGRGEDPEARLWSDTVLLSLIAAWGVFMLFALYGTVR